MSSATRWAAAVLVAAVVAFAGPLLLARDAGGGKIGAAAGAANAAHAVNVAQTVNAAGGIGGANAVDAAGAAEAAAGFYHPRAPKRFETLEQFEAWERSTHPAYNAEGAKALAEPPGRQQESRSSSRSPSPSGRSPRYTVGLTVSITSYQQRNLAHVDALIAAIESRGHRAITLVHRGAPDLARFIRSEKAENERAAVDVVIQVGSVFVTPDRERVLERLAALDVPVLSAFHLNAQNEAQYAASPTGLLPSLASAVVDAELEARFEPMAVSGRGAKREGERDSHGSDLYAVEPYQRAIAWRVDRALAWAKLRHTPNAQKRLLFTYWSQGGGKANVGGDPDDFLDVPATIVRLLREMRARGYDVGSDALPDRDTIARRMSLEGSNVGNWAPGELASRVPRGEVRLVPEDEYRAWFDALPEARRDEIIDMWGPPPGKVGVYTDARGRRSLVVPGLTFGNIVFAPNPDWGYLQDAKALMSTGALPPHHQYLAFFLWMQKKWHADAWVSFFSNISLQGGKPVGPLPDDHIGILLGTVPHIHPERLGANGGLKSKRKALAQTTSWYSIVRPSGTQTQYGELRSLLGRYASMDDGELRAEAERLIRTEVERTGLARVLDAGPTETPSTTPVASAGAGVNAKASAANPAANPAASRAGRPPDASAGRLTDVSAASLDMPDLVAAVQRELDRIDRMFVPSGSKVLGDAAEGDALTDMVTAMLGPDFIDALPAPAPASVSGATPDAAPRPGGDSERRVLARLLVRDVVIDGATPEAAIRSRLGRAAGPDARATTSPLASVGSSARQTASSDAGVRSSNVQEGDRGTGEIEAGLAAAREHAANLAAAPREVEALFAALDGRWIPPGSMDDPLRRPNAVPPGRSVYNFDSTLVPTVEAEALGIKQAETLIAAHRAKHAGAYPSSHAFAIFSGEIARNHGVTEAQILHLLGTRAVRDARGVVTGVALIPREQLGRPRVDVMLTTSGTYRDHYPDVMSLIAKATQLAATSPEDDNPVRNATAAIETAMRAEGKTSDDAARLARARVFAPAPGAYSPSIQFLAKSGDQRGDERKMAELYTSRLSHAYGDGVYGEASRPAFERQLARIDGASFTRSDVVNGMLDNPMPAGFLGGLNLAAKSVTGRDIDLYIDNLRDERNPTLESASAEIQRELRTRYFNKSWVAEMQTHGYEGARTFMYLTDHLDLWDSTATHTVASDDWREVKRVYVDDSLGVDMDGFFDRYNPHAQQVLLGNLLGAASRGQWQATTADKAQVAARLARSVSAHGIACEANMCRNPALMRLIADALEGTSDGAALLEGYTRKLSEATTAPASEPVASETETANAPSEAPSHAAAGESSTLPTRPSGVTPNQAGRTAPGQRLASTNVAPGGAASRPSPTAVAARASGASRPRVEAAQRVAATPAAAVAMVTGRVMETVAQSARPSPSSSDGNHDPPMHWSLLAGAAACVTLGWLRQARLAH